MEFESSITKITLRCQNNFIQVFTSYRITYRITLPYHQPYHAIVSLTVSRYRITLSYHAIVSLTILRNRITYCIINRITYCITLSYHLLYYATVSLTVSHNRITYCIINRIIYGITLSYHLLYHATVSLTVHLPLVLILISNSSRILISRQTVGIEIDNSIAICFAEVTFPCCII